MAKTVEIPEVGDVVRSGSDEYVVRDVVIQFDRGQLQFAGSVLHNGRLATHDHDVTVKNWRVVGRMVVQYNEGEKLIVQKLRKRK